MDQPIQGLHHVTAIVSDAQRTLNFYTGVLGLRFVKRTINFDDPGSFHLYFGDDAASPGTILTFFAWPGAKRGQIGSGETIATAFSVPPGSLSFWENHLHAAGLYAERTEPRFNQEVLAFADPDGMPLELVEEASHAPAFPSRFSPVPSEHAIRGFFGVSLAVETTAATARVLTAMGLHHDGHEAGRLRFTAPGRALGSHIDLLPVPGTAPGRLGAGSVHHIAFRNPDDASQQLWQGLLAADGLDVTPVQDRTYFHSIYFREPGGVLFEMATDPPGFTLDEPIDSLGESLRLPPWLEANRALIERRLPPLELRRPAAVR